MIDIVGPNLVRFGKLVRGTWMKCARAILIALGAAIAILPAQQRADQPKRPGDNGPATKAQINAPSRLAVDARGNIYVYESEGGAIRRIDRSTRRITTVAEECNPAWQKPRPTGCFGPISGLQVADSGKLLFSEFTYNRLSSYDLVSHRYLVIAGNVKDSICSGSGATESRGRLEKGRRNHCG